MTDPRTARLAAETPTDPTEAALLDIAESLRTIAAALASIDANGLDTYSPRPPAHSALYAEWQ